MSHPGYDYVCYVEYVDIPKRILREYGMKEGRIMVEKGTIVDDDLIRDILDGSYNERSRYDFPTRYRSFSGI